MAIRPYLQNAIRFAKQAGMFETIRVVLIEPEFAGNIGSVARAMGNMGFKDLYMVKPKPALDDLDIKRMSVASYPIIQQAKLTDNLVDAIADCEWVIGFTRRVGSERREFIPIRDLASETQRHIHTGHKVAFVFGTEKHGFSTSDATRCQQLVQIPTSTEQPSINLAQAVLLALYEIRRAHVDGEAPFEHKAADVASMEGMYDHLDELYKEVRYFDAQNEERIPMILRRLLNRARPNPQEVRVIRGLCRNALHAIKHQNKA